MQIYNVKHYAAFSNTWYNNGKEQAAYQTKLKESQKLDETIAAKEKKVITVNQLIADDLEL